MDDSPIENKMLNSKDPYGGFLIVELTPGEMIQIGDSLVVIKESRGKIVRVAVRARTSLTIDVYRDGWKRSSPLNK